VTQLHGTIRVGISGWRYAEWRGDFYPKGLPQRRELEYAAEHLTSIEINGSADALDTRAKRCRGWAAEGRDVFVYFDNDIKGFAPHDAMALIDRLG
jgi:uncharacterized protein YecE (DUF72 family)